MKTQYIFVVGIAAMTTIVGVGHAGDTNTLTVTANVTATCKFNSATSSLAFGDLDPSSSAAATSTGTTTYWCTKGTVAATTAGNGANWDAANSRRRMANGSEYIPYSLTLSGDTQTGGGKGTALTLSLAGSVANVDFINAAAGAYTDSVTLTITP